MYKGYVNAGYTIQIFHEIGNDGCNRCAVWHKR